MDSNHPHNRLRQLKGLVTIDPWHEGKGVTGRVSLHAYVHFDEARLGGQTGDEIAFRLLLRRAEIKFLQSEPKSFEIDPGEIWRGDKDAFGKVVRSVERSTVTTGSGEIAGKLGATGAELSAKLCREGAAATTDKTEFTAESSTKAILVSFQRNSRDQPTWVLKPAEHADLIEGGLALKGQPWDDKSQRLLTLGVDQVHAKAEMLSSIRLSICCKREDLVFYDISVRGKNGQFERLKDSSPKRIVMQEYLKRALLSEGLPGGDMDSPFAVIYLGEAISEYRSTFE